MEGDSELFLVVITILTTLWCNIMISCCPRHVHKYVVFVVSRRVVEEEEENREIEWNAAIFQ